MTATFASVTSHMAEESPHCPKPGRKTQYTVVDMIAKGMQVLRTKKGKASKEEGGSEVADGDDDDFELTPEEEDIMLDLDL